jgi:hypothetical protein
MGVNDIREPWCFPLCRPRSLIEWEMRTKILSPFWKKCADVDKKVTRLPEAKRYSVESTEVMKWQRYMDEVKKWDDSRLPLVGGDIERNSGRNHVTRSSVRGTTRPGLSCAKGGTR